MTTENTPAPSPFTSTTGGIPAASLPAARENWARQFVAPESAKDAGSIAAARGQWMARFDEAATPAATRAPIESPEIERAYAGLLDFGMSQAAVAEVRTSKAASSGEHEMARIWKAQFMADDARQKKYLAGDTELRKQFIAANFILSLPVRKPT